MSPADLSVSHPTLSLKRDVPGVGQDEYAAHAARLARYPVELASAGRDDQVVVSGYDLDAVPADDQALR
jgi:hypothetical protein